MEPILQKVLHGRFVEMHSIAAWAIVLTLVLHVAGVVKHQALDRENILSRMAIGLKPDDVNERS
jgi:cytochrome b561